ncbi:hypothetical protein [Bacillus fonticola]|uniref:hypothetical protein n=1 Tax=Bacillus fonticola TaxID=2728853 RepID=UPI0014752A70|nr:hypothetical protein [Bacillus fonticola]
MEECPVCNGWWQLAIPCPNCTAPLQEGGRVADYFDDYSPYLSIEMTDGAETGKGRLSCKHYVYCQQCPYEETVVFPYTVV